MAEKKFILHNRVEHLNANNMVIDLTGTPPGIYILSENSFKNTSIKIQIVQY